MENTGNGNGKATRVKNGGKAVKEGVAGGRREEDVGVERRGEGGRGQERRGRAEDKPHRGELSRAPALPAPLTGALCLGWGLDCKQLTTSCEALRER